MSRRNAIPRVKRWRITLESGEQLEVAAPTRKLAVLNLRHLTGRYDAIRSVGVLRKKEAVHA